MLAPRDFSRSSSIERTVPSWSAQTPGGLAFFEVGPVGLVLPAELLLGRFHFLPGLLQMFLLKANAVLE